MSKNKFRVIEKKLCSFVILLFTAICVSGQAVSIMVTDAESKDGLASCAVIILSDNKEVVGYTNSSGTYEFNVLTNTTKYITLKYIGYAELRDTIEVTSTQNISLSYSLSPTSLQGVSPIITANLIPEANTLLINSKNFLKLPGSFNDPSRLLIKFPGIASTNDQANFVTLKGMPPSMAGWYVNGASVANPNHLSNTGTFTDQASASGGGVNMISGNSISSFDFVQSPLTNEYFNIGSGLSDFSLDIKDGLVVSAGLLGTEAGYGISTGKFKIGANYRYSTIGILSSLGVPLGDEKINFQDGHLQIAYESQLIDWSIDAVAGKSSNVHESLGEESVLFKDALVIDFQANQQLVSGVLHIKQKRWNLDNTVNLSGRGSTRKIESDNNVLSTAIDTLEETSEIRFSMRNVLEVDVQDNWQIGYVHSNDYGLLSRNGIQGAFGNSGGLANVLFKKTSLQLSGSVGYSMIGNVTLLEWGESIEPLNKRWGSEARFLLKYFNNKNRVSVSASKSNIALLPEISIINEALIPMRSVNVSADYLYERNWGTIKAGVFFHQFNDLLISKNNRVSYFSRLDLIEESITSGEYTQDGQAEIYGLLFQYQLNKKSFQLLQSNSIYEMNISEDIISDYDFNFTSATTLSYSKDIGNNVLIVSSSYQARGGNLEFDVNEESSRIENRTIYSRETINRLKPYTRLDLKINYLWGKEISSERRFKISLDIQNLLNRRNDAYSFYDPLAERVVLQNQLGVIPILRFTWIVL